MKNTIILDYAKRFGIRMDYARGRFYYEGKEISAFEAASYGCLWNHLLQEDVLRKLDQAKNLDECWACCQAMTRLARERRILDAFLDIPAVEEKDFL
ncbi:MAG: hypothetical protein LUE14_04280 [Clostridiales bacterium]|nr:hypothetical protein [Clostridiales bacterium]